MKTINHNNLEIRITLTNAYSEYLFYLNDILNEMSKRDPSLFEFNIMRPNKDGKLVINVSTYGCTDSFRNYVYRVFNKLFSDDPDIFEYITVNSDSYPFDSEKFEEANLKQCDKILVEE